MHFFKMVNFVVKQKTFKNGDFKKVMTKNSYVKIKFTP